jgi:hypothetical protein
MKQKEKINCKDQFLVDINKYWTFWLRFSHRMIRSVLSSIYNFISHSLALKIKVSDVSGIGDSFCTVLPQSEVCEWLLASAVSNGSVHQRDMTVQIVGILNETTPFVDQNTVSQQGLLKSKVTQFHRIESVPGSRWLKLAYCGRSRV